jgi:sulfane dehydrogenase subunit SoxC
VSAATSPWLTADAISLDQLHAAPRAGWHHHAARLCFERHHGGSRSTRKEDYRLMINGLVDTPLVFTMEDLMRFPRENRVYFLECAANYRHGMARRAAQRLQFTHGMIHNVMDTGVPLRLLLEEAGLRTNATSGSMPKAPMPRP